MSMEKSLPPRTFRCYRITVEGKIDPSWSDWLGGLQLSSRKEAGDLQITTLSRIHVDQAGLRGLLNRLWDLNLVLRSVRQVDPVPTSDKE